MFGSKRNRTPPQRIQRLAAKKQMVLLTPHYRLVRRDAYLCKQLHLLRPSREYKENYINFLHNFNVSITFTSKFLERVDSDPCDFCRHLNRVCVVSDSSDSCSPCLVFRQRCSRLSVSKWDSFQAKEALTRFELSVLSEQLTKCLQRLSEILIGFDVPNKN